jgi:hypothetical protein
MLDIIAVAIRDVESGDGTYWSIALTNGKVMTGLVKPMGDGFYAIETPQPWYFHVSHVVAISLRPPSDIEHSPL